MKVPLVRFQCGCVGISLERPSATNEGSTDIWLFMPCDSRGEGGILGSIRPMPNHKTCDPVPLTPEEFEQVRQKMQQQLQAGDSMFNLVASVDRGRDCAMRFHTNN